MAYIFAMVLIETMIFTRIISELMSDDQYRELQNAIVGNPEAGDLIKKSGGLRKLRWRLEGRGKRGGSRVIYYWATADDQIYMLYAYVKNEQADFADDQLKTLKAIVERW
ncbi:MAG TPA: type II toxin-antitoxin system RelE/ParE family toxin [Gammaproteobacteria bacterium]|nr:type II toxin-antitoxin system RelE/ParE family toxin [Gammaproteobacteria bacterium]